MNKKKLKKDLVFGAYDLKAIFEDSYEYEVYFKLANSGRILDLCPTEMEVEFSLKIKQLRLSFPDSEPKLVRVMIPINKAQNNTKKRAELRGRYFQQYCELIPKMRLSIKNQLTALKKELVNPEEVAFINKKVKNLRKAGLKKTKLNLKKMTNNRI